MKYKISILLQALSTVFMWAIVVIYEKTKQEGMLPTWYILSFTLSFIVIIISIIMSINVIRNKKILHKELITKVVLVVTGLLLTFIGYFVKADYIISFGVFLILITSLSFISIYYAKKYNSIDELLQSKEIKLKHIYNIYDKSEFAIAICYYVSKKSSFGENTNVLSKSEKTLYIFNQFITSIYINGFEQAIKNGHYIYLSDTVNVLIDMNAHKILEIYEDIIENTNESSQKILEKDNLFNKIDTKEIDYLIYQYVKKNKKDIS